MNPHQKMFQKYYEVSDLNVSVEQIMNNLSPAYRIRLVAGRKGVQNSEIDWVSVVEDYSDEKFKHLNRIVLTSGMNNVCDDKLISFIKNLGKVKVRAIIINIGKYIKEIPKEAIEYCNENDIPLYTMPWDVLMNDVTKDIARVIIRCDTESENIPELIKGIIFNTDDIKVFLNKLSVYGFSDRSVYCPMVVRIENLSEYKSEMLIHGIENTCIHILDKFGEPHTKNGGIITFLYKNMVVIVFVDADRNYIERAIQALNENLTIFIEYKISMCVGKLNDTIYNLSSNFKKLTPFLNVAAKSETGVVFYDDMGMYKILSEVGDKNILDETYTKTIGKLIKYDQINGTILTEYIKKYIALDGNVLSVAKTFFVHRNTVNNHLRKIKDITGINPLSLDGKILFATAIKISELYDI